MNNEFIHNDELSIDIDIKEAVKANKKTFKKAISKINLLFLLLSLIALFASVLSLIISAILIIVNSTIDVSSIDESVILSNPFFTVINMFLPVFISLVSGIFISKALFKIKFRDFFVSTEKIMVYSAKGALACISFGSVGLLFTLLIINFFNLFNLKVTMPDISIPSEPLSMIINLSYICLIGPIFEEIIFRGFIFKAARYFGTSFAIIFSSILFGIFHGNLLQLFPATLMGIVLAYITVKSNSLIPAIIAHICNNSFRYLEEFILNNSFINSKISNIVSISIVVITIIIALILTLKDLNEIKSINNSDSLLSISTSKKFLYSFTSIPFVLAFIYFIINCISLFIITS